MIADWVQGHAPAGGDGEFGTHAELMQKKGVYYKLVMAQRQTTKMKKAQPQTC